MFFNAAKVWLSAAEAWQFVQYWPKPENGSGLAAAGGQSACQPLHPIAPQNHPSYAACRSRIMTAMPPLIGLSHSQSMLPHAAAGAVYISLMIMAPSGTGSTAVRDGVPSADRFALSQRYISGEYQTSTGAWVPLYVPVHCPP